MEIVNVDTVTFEESEYHRGRMVWKAATMYNHVKAMEYPVFDLPLIAVNLTVMPFVADNMLDVIVHSKRIRDCELKHPILLDNFGQIADGYHRVCKAILEGNTTIKAIRMATMPPCDYEKESEDD